MFAFQTTPPPPPPPPIRMYRTFLPVVLSEEVHHICVVLENQYQSTCDYVMQDNMNRWYVEDEGIFDSFISREYFTIDGVLYNVIGFGVVGGQSLPDHMNILYVKIGDMYYWVDIAIIGTSE